MIEKFCLGMLRQPFLSAGTLERAESMGILTFPHKSIGPFLTFSGATRDAENNDVNPGNKEVSNNELPE